MSLDMASGSAGSPIGSQPTVLSDIQRRRRSKQQARIIGLMLFTTIVTVVTFVMGFTCTKIYMNSAPDLGITGLVKKTVFIVFLLCNSIPMISSVIATVYLIWPQHLGHNPYPLIHKAMIRAMALVQLAFLSMLVAFMVGVFLVLILLPYL